MALSPTMLHCREFFISLWNITATLYCLDQSCKNYEMLSIAITISMAITMIKSRRTTEMTEMTKKTKTTKTRKRTKMTITTKATMPRLTRKRQKRKGKGQRQTMEAVICFNIDSDRDMVIAFLRTATHGKHSDRCGRSRQENLKANMLPVKVGKNLLSDPEAELCKNPPSSQSVTGKLYQNCNRRQTFPQEEDNIKIVRVQGDALWHSRARGNI